MSERQCETANLLTSDWHYGKATATYNPDVFRGRLAALGRRVLRIRECLAGYQFDRLIVWIGGDINDGTGIYPGQEHYQAVTDVRAQAREWAQLTAGWLRTQAATWGNVEVQAVPGNHGRAGRFAHEASSWDLVALDALAAEVKTDGIPVRYDGDDPFVRRVDVRGHRYLLYHGHGIRSYQSIPWYGIQQRLLRWYNSSYGPFDVAMLGHFHSCQMTEFNGFCTYLTGTLVSGDEWARRELGMESAPRWWMFGTSDSRPVTWQYRLDLADE